ncbi:MAG: hypothetical protein JWN48_872 [Myxococcaceae bacterium]|nr:hypothetical protein [Myxococcaceae bacterium]
MSSSPIGRKLAIAFGLVSVLAALLCLVNVLLVADVAEEVATMTRNEKLIREGLDLAKALREQYIHAAHNIAQGDRSHLDHYGEWVSRVAESAARLEHLAPAEERTGLTKVVEASRLFDREFRQFILPAIDTDDDPLLRETHRRIEPLLGRASHEADELAARFERHMSHAHVSTTKTTRLGIALAFGGILLIVIVAAVSTVQIRRALVLPLSRLVHAAGEIGKGSFTQPVGHVGDGEFAELGQAFDRMTEELSKRQAQLVRSERMAAIGQLAAGVAHEINNPIGIIRGYLNTMLPEAHDETLKEELRILDEEAAACQRIDEDLLTYARLPGVEKTAIRIEGLIDDVVRRFGCTSKEKQVHLRVEAAPCKLDADPVRLRQLINNLIRNAVEAGSDEVVVVGEKSGNQTYTIRVMDRGPGIAEANLEPVFEPFFSENRNGTGLGLAVCLGIVRAHSGTIVAQAREGGGAELVVRLPTAGG